MMVYDRDDKLREMIADLCHTQWSGWMKYLLSKCHYDSDGNIVIHRDYIDNLKVQMNTRYRELSEIDKNKDRLEASKFLAIFNGYIDCKNEEAMLSEYGPEYMKKIGLK